MKENRRTIRLLAPIGLVYRRASKFSTAKGQPTLARDLSGGGVRFAARDALRRGELLEVELQIPHLEEPVRAVGEVVWFRDGGARGVHEAALRFTDIEAGDLNRVLEYVHAVGIGQSR